MNALSRFIFAGKEWVSRIPCLAYFVVVTLMSSLSFSTPVLGSDIVFHLSGDVEYPGTLVLKHESNIIEHLCFLGQTARGNVDRGFLKFLSQNGVPEGDYNVSSPTPEERWPNRFFRKSGALRLQPVSPTAIEKLARLGLNGIAVHGRDFYPILHNRVRDKKMIAFYNDLLFERMGVHWGPLRITNWDMGRLYDYWERYTKSQEQWKGKVVAADLAVVKKQCKPPVVKRKPDE